MFLSFKELKSLFAFKVFVFILIFSVFLNFTGFTNPAYAQAVLNLPQPGTMVPMTQPFAPVIVKGINIQPDNPLQFDFVIQEGDQSLDDAAFKKESTKLIKYFLASLTVPEKQMWVNLSPYEKDRIIPKTFGQTEIGRDLLAQDYMLKQLSSSLMYPENELGKKFWERVYSRAMEEYSTTDIPMNTFNKIWIVPETAQIYEHEKGAYIIKNHLKVMLEEDYLALEANKNSTEHGLRDVKKSQMKIMTGVTSKIVKEILIPEIEKEVNVGEIFAPLRQIYNSMLLASWYKKALKDSILGKAYVNKEIVKGVEVKDKEINQKIYNQYVEAFKKGVFDLVKEEYDPSKQEIIPRKYFSGGMALDEAQTTVVEKVKSRDVDTDTPSRLVTWDANLSGGDSAMTGRVTSIFTATIVTLLIMFFPSFIPQMEKAGQDNGYQKGQSEVVGTSQVLGELTKGMPALEKKTDQTKEAWKVFKEFKNMDALDFTKFLSGHTEEELKAGYQAIFGKYGESVRYGQKTFLLSVYAQDYVREAQKQMQRVIDHLNSLKTAEGEQAAREIQNAQNAFESFLQAAPGLINHPLFQEVKLSSLDSFKHFQNGAVKPESVENEFVFLSSALAKVTTAAEAESILPDIERLLADLTAMESKVLQANDSANVKAAKAFPLNLGSQDASASTKKSDNAMTGDVFEGEAFQITDFQESFKATDILSRFYGFLDLDFLYEKDLVKKSLNRKLKIESVHPEGSIRVYYGETKIFERTAGEGGTPGTIEALYDKQHGLYLLADNKISLKTPDGIFAIGIPEGKDVRKCFFSDYQLAHIDNAMKSDAVKDNSFDPGKDREFRKAVNAFDDKLNREIKGFFYGFLIAYFIVTAVSSGGGLELRLLYYKLCVFFNFVLVTAAINIVLKEGVKRGIQSKSRKMRSWGIRGTFGPFINAHHFIPILEALEEITPFQGEKIAIQRAIQRISRKRALILPIVRALAVIKSFMGNYEVKLTRSHFSSDLDYAIYRFNKIIAEKFDIPLNAIQAEKKSQDRFKVRIALPDQYNGYYAKTIELQQKVTAILDQGNGTYTVRSTIDSQVTKLEFTIDNVIDADSNDQAMTAKNGGIDLNPAIGAMDVEKKGSGFIMPKLDPVMLESINIQSITPVIINIQTITNLPLLLGLADEPDKDENPHELVADKKDRQKVS